MYCSKCGVLNDKTYKYCINCGNKLNIKKSVTVSRNRENSTVLGILCLSTSIFINIFSFIPGILSIMYSYRYKKESGEHSIGFVLSILGMIISVIILFFIILFFMFIINIDINNVSNDSTLEKINYKYEGVIRI